MASEFGRLLRQHREGAKLSQRELADRLRVSSASVSYWEAGQRMPQWAMLERITAELGLEGEAKSELTSIGRSGQRATPETRQLLESLFRKLNDATLPDGKRAELLYGIEDTVNQWEAGLKRNVRFAVIPAAGWQSDWFSPAATARLVECCIDEARDSGIETVFVVVGATDERSIASRLPGVRQRTTRLVVQDEPLGTGHATAIAWRQLPPNEPLAVLFPDERFDDCLGPMVDFYNQNKCTIVGLRLLQPRERGVGIVTVKNREGCFFPVETVRERPRGRLGGEPLAIIGRYILAPEAFPVMERVPPRDDQIEITSALAELAPLGKLFGYFYQGQRWSISDARRQLTQEFRQFVDKKAKRKPRQQ